MSVSDESPKAPAFALQEKIRRSSLVCAANWKMHKNPAESASFVREMKEKLSAGADECLYMIFPPAPCWSAINEACNDSDLVWGAQNVFTESQGAFTGENSPELLKEMGGQISLVGHSERRQIFSESDELCAAKVKALQERCLMPLLCIGESLEERQAGQTNEKLRAQLEKGLFGVDWNQPLMIAYEPVWAIGTGLVAEAAQIEEAHALIREFLIEQAGKEFGEVTAILYGGSVKPNNAAELRSIKNVDGFLVGGASLQVTSLLQISGVST